jgi:hypothetical protein
MPGDEGAGPARLVLNLTGEFEVQRRTDVEIVATRGGFRLRVMRCPAERFESLRSSLSQMAASGRTRSGNTPVPEAAFRLGGCEG